MSTILRVCCGIFVRSYFTKWETKFQLFEIRKHYQHYYWISLDIFHKACWTKILKAITSLVIDGKGEPLLIQVWDSQITIRLKKNQISSKNQLPFYHFRFFSYWCYMVYGNKTEKIRKTVLHQKFFSPVLTRTKRTVFSLCINFLPSSMYDNLLTNFRNLLCSLFPTS